VRLFNHRSSLPPQARYDENRTSAPFVDQLSDEELRRLSELLPWRCFTVDSHGRPFGGVAWRDKRNAPQVIPDPRILRFHDRVDLSDRHVLEVGCFEGVHTIALCRLAAAVTAIDSRVENVVKTIVRCAFYDEHPKVFPFDVEARRDDDLLHADLCHHVGVLYHLVDPVSHLHDLGRLISRGVMLDTHFALPADATEEYEVEGHAYRYRRYQERGREDVFSGMGAHSKWLLLEDIESTLHAAGFDLVDVVEKRDERNGPRVLLFAER
jgi:Protein of unknown function (DUF1698)